MATIIQRPYIIDVEASGFGSRSYPIEIGLAMEKASRYCSLILPARAWTHWDNTAEQTHCITRDLLKAHGKPVREVAEELNRLLGHKTVYSDGWSVDKPWITLLFSKAGIRQTFWVSPLERILSEPQMEIWHPVKKQVAASLNLTRHRASADAYIIQETFVKTLGLAPESHQR